MLILGIETSCDDTAVALYHSERGLLGHCLHSQIDLGLRHGGVVPELASRDHLRHILPLTQQILTQTGCQLLDLDAIAYTAGPGLIGALLVGASFGQSLAWALEKPAIPIHHLEGHLLAPMLSSPAPTFPFLALIVSGGHTLLASVKGLGDYAILGQSLDDAAGEAFDKTAKLLGLGFPGGPAIEQLARRGQPNFTLSRPMIARPGLDFSFSGLKTQVAVVWENCPQTEQDKSDLAYAFQETVADTLAIKCKRALAETGLKQLVVAGGVSANQRLRQHFADKLAPLVDAIYYPELAFCTDNAAMIAYAGYLRFCQMSSQATASNAITARAAWPLNTLSKQ